MKTCLEQSAFYRVRRIRATLRIALFSVAFASFLLPASAASATVLPEHITENTTLTTGGSPYTGASVVRPGVTLKIEPGVKLNLGGLWVEGTLKAEGTAEEPVVFTGPKEASAGEWCHIAFEPGSGASVIDHAEVSYGGACGIAPIWVRGSSPTITNSLISHSSAGGIEVESGGAPEIAHDILLANAKKNISYLAAGSQSGEVNIHDNLIIGGEKGIYVKSTSSGSVLGTDLGSNTIIKTTNSALFYQGQDIPGDITGNTLLENSENLITINEGRVAHSSTWENGGTPVEIEGAVKVASGVTLKITKGVRLLHPELYVEGTLKAEGTAEEPVVFTGPKEASAGEWCHIAFEPGSGASVIDHAEVSYGGACGIAPIWVRGSSPTITNSLISHSSAGGIEVESAAPRKSPTTSCSPTRKRTSPTSPPARRAVK